MTQILHVHADFVINTANNTNKMRYFYSDGLCVEVVVVEKEDKYNEDETKQEEDGYSMRKLFFKTK